MFHVALQTLLFGRALLVSEIPFEQTVLEQHIRAGYVKGLPGIVDGKCQRCHNDDEALFAHFPCYSCGEMCLYCRYCINMGRVSACTLLYVWTGPEVNFEGGALSWQGQLSPQQKEASDKIMEAVRESKPFLLWAVAGAGKTETVFCGIAFALQRGQRVALTCPRVDVILELAPRIREVFPETEIAVLHGTSSVEDKNPRAQLVLATTHQLFRFRKAFDVMIVDEVDAFPFSAERSLQLAVDHAVKKESTVIFLTATPKPAWQKEFFAGTRNGFLIPARFHRYPNPVPTMQWIGNWRKYFASGKVPHALRDFLVEQKNSGRPFLVFFPHIALMERALPSIQKVLPGTLSVHAEDSERKEKVMKLRQHEIPGLLTTTILERGVTIKAVDVAVIGAEDRTFDEAALVQIAGRVGRSPDFPTGKVVLFHQGKTREMTAAIQHIEKNNRLSKERGLLD